MFISSFLVTPFRFVFLNKLLVIRPNKYTDIVFKCDIPVVFYEFNIYSVQLAIKTQLIYCTVCTVYKNYMFRPILAIFRFFV